MTTRFGNDVSPKILSPDQVADEVIQTAAIGIGAITTDKLADGAVTADKIAPGVLTSADIADGSLTSLKIADGAVIPAKLSDGIPGTKLAADSIPYTAITGEVSGMRTVVRRLGTVTHNNVKSKVTGMGAAVFDPEGLWSSVNDEFTLPIGKYVLAISASHSIAAANTGLQYDVSVGGTLLGLMDTGRPYTTGTVASSGIVRALLDITTANTVVHVEAICAGTATVLDDTEIFTLERL